MKARQAILIDLLGHRATDGEPKVEVDGDVETPRLKNKRVLR